MKQRTNLRLDTIFFALLTLLVLAVLGLGAQVSNQPTTSVNISVVYPLTAISATAAANTQTTLTIPAPGAGLYNYVCSLGFNASNNNTGAVITNAVSTSTNFNAFAIKFSVLSTASNNYDLPYMTWGSPTTGCVKSTSPGTATTFVSPGAATNFAFTWYATYYQAP